MKESNHIMLRGVKGLHGDSLRARDGEIGSVDEVLFDDEHWTVQYTVEITNELPKPVV